MNICIVFSTPFPPEEGIGSYVYNLSHKLTEKGHRVSLVTRGSWKHTPGETADGIAVYKPRFFPAYPLHVYLHGMFANRLLKSLEPSFDVVHIHSPLSPVIHTSLPVVATIHSPLKADARLDRVFGLRSIAGIAASRLFGYPLEKGLLQRASVVSAVSRSGAEELREYGVDPDRVSVIGNGVDEKFFCPVTAKQDRRYVLYAGRLDCQKGLSDLVECARSVCRDFPDVNFVIAGDGPYRDRLRSEIRAAGLRDRFLLPGRVPRSEIVSLYQNATVFTLPSYHEGLPTSVLEAMSCGVPVVATRVRGNTDVISAGDDGLLVPARAPQELSAAIASLLRDPGLRERLGKAARAKIENAFTWDIVVDRVVALYESVVRK